MESLPHIASMTFGVATMWLCRAAGVLLALSVSAAASAQDFQVVKVASVPASAVSDLKAKTILLNDYRLDETSDKGAFIHFEEWVRTKPVQVQFLNLFPDFKEGMAHKVIDGLRKEVKDALQLYVTEARFKLSRPASAIDLTKYATLPFIQSIDPAIKHRTIAPSEVSVMRDERSANNKNPHRAWCEGAGMTCIRSAYKLEGRLPLGVALANKLRDGDRKVSDTIEFESELRVIPQAEIDQEGLKRLTGINTPVAGALEQTMFYVNQMMRFGKLLAVFQPNPADPNTTVATVMISLAVSSSTLETQRKYQTVPVLRNLVPVQVLLGHSSFNTGNSISSGLPNYVRNQIKAIAGSMERG